MDSFLDGFIGWNESILTTRQLGQHILVRCLCCWRCINANLHSQYAHRQTDSPHHNNSAHYRHHTARQLTTKLSNVCVCVKQLITGAPVAVHCSHMKTLDSVYCSDGRSTRCPLARHGNVGKPNASVIVWSDILLYLATSYQHCSIRFPACHALHYAHATALASWSSVQNAVGYALQKMFRFSVWMLQWQNITASLKQ